MQKLKIIDLYVPFVETYIHEKILMKHIQAKTYIHEIRSSCETMRTKMLKDIRAKRETEVRLDS